MLGQVGETFRVYFFLYFKFKFPLLFSCWTSGVSFLMCRLSDSPLRAWPGLGSAPSVGVAGAGLSSRSEGVAGGWALLPGTAVPVPAARCQGGNGGHRGGLQSPPSAFSPACPRREAAGRRAWAAAQLGLCWPPVPRAALAQRPSRGVAGALPGPEQTRTEAGKSAVAWLPV